MYVFQIPLLQISTTPILLGITVKNNDLALFLDAAGTARERVATATPRQVAAAIAAPRADVATLAVLLSDAADGMLEAMAGRAQRLTRSHFGRTVSLYAPLYLSNYCPGGCSYCGFAADRQQSRRRLEPAGIETELQAIYDLGLRDVLLLTGERCPEADFDYLALGVEMAARRFPAVGVEAFPMTEAEYARLVALGCISLTLYQETYDRLRYDEVHRWGPKRDYVARLEAPERALRSGIRSVGIGALFGLADPVTEALALFQHAVYLKRKYWKSGVMISFPRLCSEQGGFSAEYSVSDQWLAKVIWAFRLCLPDVPLVLSTRERPAFRDGMAGVGISRMSVASRTSVGGYADAGPGADDRQFSINDDRGVDDFCAMLRTRGLQPVFKNWDVALRDGVAA